MPNIGLLPSCLFFSHLLIISSSGPVTSLSVSVSHLLTFTSPAPSLSYFLSLLPFLKFSHFHASHTPSPFSTCSADSSAAAARCYTSRPAPVAPRVPCDTGRRGCGGVRAVLAGGRSCSRHHMNGTADDGLTRKRMGGCPLALSHVTDGCPHGKTRV